MLHVLNAPDVFGDAVGEEGDEGEAADEAGDEHLPVELLLRLAFICRRKRKGQLFELCTLSLPHLPMVNWC